ncbi:MAG: hypothetical protein EOO74_10695, partial [Myxococcales bacterium]
KENGSVVAWGWNTEGQCNVPAAAQSGVVAVAAGYDFSWALKEDGTLIGWGSSDDGWITVPAAAQEGVVDVSSVSFHTIAQVAAAYAKLDQTEVFAGDSATGTVKLAQAAPAGGAVVGLVSNDPQVQVPSSVTIPAGATSATFPIFTSAFIGNFRTAVIQTSYNGTKTVSAYLKVKGNPVAATFSAASTVGGSTTKPVMTLSIGTPLANDTVFSLEYAPSLTGPSTLTIPAGATSAQVSVVTSRVASPTTGSSVTAKYEGAEVGTGSIEVLPLRATMIFDASSVQSGETAYGTVYLNAPVRETVNVDLATDTYAAPVPARVTVKATSRVVTFAIPTRAVPANTYARITATIAGNSNHGNLKLLATPAVRSLTLPASVYGNGRVTGTVRLSMAGK